MTCHGPEGIPAAEKVTAGGGCTARRACDGAPCWLTAGHRGVHEVHAFHRCPEHGRVFAFTEGGDPR
jgi:hypothetical protein